MIDEIPFRQDGLCRIIIFSIGYSLITEAVLVYTTFYN